MNNPKIVQGIRLRDSDCPARPDGSIDLPLEISRIRCSYGTEDGITWYCNTPNGCFGNLGLHGVVEHADGTITVNPSILVESGRGGLSYHGWLKNGIWEEC